MTNQYRPEIDGLRAIAVLAVLLLHTNFTWISGGFLGVDIFFVISGYLITRLIVEELDKGSFSFSDFFVRRARRILPALFCVSFISLLAGWFFFLPDDFKSLGRSALALSLFSSNIYFWLKSGYFTAPADSKPLLHTWSLALEEQFYFVFPFVLYFITLYFSKYRLKLISCFLFLSLILTWWGMKNNQIAAFFLLPTRAWELLLGSSIALYFSQRKNIAKAGWLNEMLSFAGLFMITLALFFTDKNLAFPEVALLPCLGTALIIVSAERQKTLVSQILSLPLMVQIGLISYSLYLWHWPLFVFVKYIKTHELTLFDRLEVIGLSILLAYLTHRFIETPIRKKQILIPPKKFFLTITVLGSFLFVFGFWINFKEGMPSRLNPLIFSAYQKPNQRIKANCQTIKLSKNLSVCGNTKKNEKPDIILWGDSHAEMILAHFEKLVTQHKLKFWYYACVPVLNVYRVDLFASLKASDCYYSNHELVKLIEKNQIKHLFLVSFWSQFTEGKELPIEGAGRRDPFYADKMTQSSSPLEARAVFRENFKETVNILSKAKVEIWILKQVPAHQFWVPNQLAKTLKYGGNKEQIGRPLAEHLKRQIFIDKVFKEIKSDNIHFLDPATILCKERQFCLAVQHNEALYRDFNHLSDEGVMMLTPLFQSIFLASMI